MGPSVVIEAQEGPQGSGATRRAEKRAPIRPLPQQRLDKSLGFPVGPRRVGPGKAMPELPGPTDAGETARLVARPVVREHASHGDATAAKPDQRVAQKGGTGTPALRATDFHKR